MTHSLDVESEILRILVAEEQCVERLDHKNGYEQSESTDSNKEWQAVERHATEVAEPPDHVGLHSFLRSKEIEERDGRRRDIPYHDAGDEQHDVVLDHKRKKHDECEHQHSSDKGRGQHRHES